jgi:hypothetical protein
VTPDPRNSGAKTNTLRNRARLAPSSNPDRPAADRSSHRGDHPVATGEDALPAMPTMWQGCCSRRARLSVLRLRLSHHRHLARLAPGAGEGGNPEAHRGGQDRPGASRGRDQGSDPWPVGSESLSDRRSPSVDCALDAGQPSLHWCRVRFDGTAYSPWPPPLFCRRLLHRTSVASGSQAIGGNEVDSALATSTGPESKPSRSCCPSYLLGVFDAAKGKGRNFAAVVRSV